jgi:hypothetical protein
MAKTHFWGAEPAVETYTQNKKPFTPNYDHHHHRYHHPVGRNAAAAATHCGGSSGWYLFFSSPSLSSLTNLPPPQARHITHDDRDHNGDDGDDNDGERPTGFPITTGPTQRTGQSQQSSCKVVIVSFPFNPLTPHTYMHILRNRDERISIKSIRLGRLILG